MNPQLILLAGLALAACSTHKNQTSSTAATATTQQHRIAVHDSASLLLERIQFTHSRGGRLAEVDIVPRGTFRYHPDSGYTGEAERIAIKQSALTYRTTADSLTTSGTATSATAAEQQASAYTAHEVTQQQLERHPLITPHRWWVWPAAAAILLAIVWLYRWIRRAKL